MCVQRGQCQALQTAEVSEGYCAWYLGTLTASKGILLWRAGVVGNLYTPALSYGVVVQVDIGALVEAVVRGLLGWRGDVVVDVCEAVTVSMCVYVKFVLCLQCQE